MLRRQFTAMLAAAAMILVSSCGGGGGSDFTPQPDPGDLPISSANAKSITGAVLVVVTSTMELASFVDVFGLPVLGGPDAALAAGFQKTVLVQQVPCDQGVIVATWTDEDDNAIVSTGDSFLFDFQSCYMQDDDITLDGGASLSDLILSGDPINQIAPWGIEFTFGFDQVQGTEGGLTSTMDGDFWFSTSTQDNVLIETAITTDSFLMEALGESDTLSQYVMTQTRDFNTGMITVAADGVLTSTLFNGSVEFDTLTTFAGFYDDNPYEGQLLIADDSSSVLMTVIDSINVRLEIDFDKDGTIDDTQTVPWSDFGID